MKRNKGTMVLMLFAMVSLIACGGGGGGTSGTATPNALLYTGSTSAAVINNTNAAHISVGAVNGGIKGNSLSISASLTGSNDTPDQKRYNTIATAMIMQDAVYNLVANSDGVSNSDRALHTEQETMPGPCGGQTSGTITIDDVTGNFWGALTYVNYCSSNVFINGTVSFSGEIDLVSGNFINISMSFDYITGNDPTGSYVLDGHITIDFTGASKFTLNIDMLLQEGSTGQVFWINDYVVQSEDFGSYVSLDISGRFYDPNYGYVTLSTQQAMIVNHYDANPSSGVIIFTGEIGSSGGQTSAVVTCFPGDIFQVDVDIDGDGIYDWFSGDLNWYNY